MNPVQTLGIVDWGKLKYVFFFFIYFITIQMIENNDNSEEKIKLKQNMEGTCTNYDK